MSVILPRRFNLACGTPLSHYTYSERLYPSLGVNLVSIDWSASGQQLYLSFKIVRGVVNAIDTIGSTSWDLSDVGGANPRSSPTNYRYQFINEIGSGGNCWSGIVTPAPDLTAGGQLLLALSSGTGVNKIAQYTLPFPYDLRQGDHAGNPATSDFYPTYEPVLVGQFDAHPDNGAQGLNDLKMSPDGTVMIANSSIIGGSCTLGQWNLTTPYDILGTMSYKSVNVAGYGFLAMHIKPEGTCVYLTKSGEISKFILGTAWDISTIVLPAVETLDVSNEVPGTIASIYITESDLYVLGSGTGTIYQYSR